jgi:hypothetical protein
MLILPEISTWLGLPTDFQCLKARRLLKKAGIEPAVHGGGGRSYSMWRFSDLQPLAHLARPAYDDEAA